MLRMLASCLLLGLSFGAAEVALRSSPRLGLSPREILAWVLVSGGLMALYALAAGLLLHLLRPLRERWRGLLLGALLLPQLLLAWRFEVVLNEFLYEPVVWGGLLALSAFTLLLGLLAVRPLVALGRRLDAVSFALFTLAVLVAFLRGAPTASSGPGADARAPDILLVTLDTVRADVLSPWGGAASCPTLDRLARDGALFEQAFATAPLTEASHLAMLTGVSPHRSGVVSNGTEIGERPLLLSHELRRAGYRTAGFVAGFPLHGRYGWAQGFDLYDDDFGDFPGLHRLSLVKAWDQVFLPGHTLRERRGDRVLGRARRWLQGGSDQPRFCWLHLFDPHGPYEAPAPFAPAGEPDRGGPSLDLPAYWPPALRAIPDAVFHREAYQGEIRFTDFLLGEIVGDLEAAGRLDDTIVMVVADHGESLGEHDYWFDHGDDLYDPSLHVPLLVRWPARVAPSRVPCQVSTVDVAPTLLDLVGLPPGDGRDGRSLLPFLRGEACEARDAVASTTAGRFMARPPVDHALRARGRKFILHDPEVPPLRSPELYDLVKDPGETRDLATERPDEAAAMGLALQASLEGAATVAGPSTDPGTLEALKVLGYVE
jgi:arylsulfatase A-like enzyme